jgi:hypothetical protein
VSSVFQLERSPVGEADMDDWPIAGVIGMARSASALSERTTDRCLMGNSGNFHDRVRVGAVQA